MSSPTGGPRRRPRSRPAAASAPRTRAAEPVSSLDAELAAAQARPEPPARTFAELGLPAPMVAALAERGVVAPFAIQSRALPDALDGRDVLARARTGSGKTLAFGLPLLARIAASGSRRVVKSPRGLVLVPTRELAKQVADELEPAAKALGLRLTTVFGGVSAGRQISALAGGVDLVVATPGRLLDLMGDGYARLDAVEIAVLDEADHMADLGFLPAVTKILDATPSGRQCMLFSATLDRGVDRLVKRYLSNPAVHAVASPVDVQAAMSHHLFTVGADQKLAVAARIASRPARTLFFVRTKHGADRLAKQLTTHGAEARAIHGNLNQNQRQRALDGFSLGVTRVLVATDVAARGIHVDDVDLVVHYDPPNDHKDYLHRSGRTARAGATGTVVSLVEHHQRADMAKLHSAAGVKAESATVGPDHEAVLKLATSGEAIVVPEGARERLAPPVAAPVRNRGNGGGRKHAPSGGSRGRGGAASGGRTHAAGGSGAPVRTAGAPAASAGGAASPRGRRNHGRSTRPTQPAA